MLFTVALTAYPDDLVFLPHALSGLMNQECKDFELIVVVKCQSEPASESFGQFRNTLPAQYYYLPPSETWGNRQRHRALVHATGHYITWLSADNLVYPNWLLSHRQNIEERDGAVSVVNTHHWYRGGFQGTMPQGLDRGKIDLLNFAVPTEMAKRIDAFGEWIEREPSSDWFVFEKCHAEGGSVWHSERPPCACHF